MNVTSIHGLFGEETALSYDVSKSGLNQATRTLAIEFGPHGILVNAVAPGFVSTRMSVADGRNELESDWFWGSTRSARRLHERTAQAFRAAVRPSALEDGSDG